MREVIVFIVLSIVNVILQTVKSIITVKGSKWVASIINMLTYGVYTYVLVYTTADTFELWQKALIVGSTNFVGVFIVKVIEEKTRKDKIWKVEFTVKNVPCRFSDIVTELKENHIPFQYQMVENRYIRFDTYCNTQADTTVVNNIIKKYGGKCFVTENRIIL